MNKTITNYYETGEKKWVTTYYGNVYDKTITKYYPSGAKECQFEFTDGKKNGDFIIFDEKTGRITCHLIYKDDMIVRDLLKDPTTHTEYDIRIETLDSKIL
jgi:antitoxin component YwqK of YwqJK toxin-antitoxin module